MEKTKPVRVNLGARSYDVVVGAGLMANAGEYLQSIVKGRRVALVSDETVLGRYLDILAPQLDAITPRWFVYKLSGGEKVKSFEGVSQLINQMLDDGIDRKCVVIAFGGGVVGDVGGFAAALLMRGIELIQMPTTLMSQVDSAIGGKNGINTRHGKNLVGSFLQPRIVLNDVSVLESLPPSEFKSGYAEIMKYALLSSEEEYTWVEDHVESIFARHEPILVDVVRLSCKVKANIVSEDELDRGKRAFVNLGHTFAHAFENHAGYGHFPHGYAVAVGVIAACKLSERVNACPQGLYDRIERHTRAARLPVNLQELSPSIDWQGKALYNIMLHDKKAFDGKIHFVLLHGPGRPFSKADVELAAVSDTLQTIGANVESMVAELS